MRILNITNCIPYPPITGAPLRTYNILRCLAKKNEVYLAAFAETEEHVEGLIHLREFCKHVEAAHSPKPGKPARLFKGLECFCRGIPPELGLSHSRMMAKKIQGLVSQIEFDVVIIEHTIMGLYLEALPPALRKRTAWLLHDIDYDKLKRISHLEPGTIRKLQLKGRSIMMRSWMPRFADRFGLCVTVSDMDRRLLVSANDRLKVEVSPNGVDTHRYNPLPEEEGAPALLFVGNMGYGPNIDAVDYFCRRILPLVQRGVPDTELWIVGTNPPARVKALCGGAVHVTGGVEHIEPYYSRCKVCIVPLRAGSGTRLKILEAMALARPVVSTTLGCEGLDVADGVHVLLADSAQGFAEKTVELLVKPELRRRLAAKARELVVSRYDWDTIAERLQEILSQLKNESVASAALAPPTFTVDSFQPR